MVYSVKHEDTGNNSGIKIEDNNTSTTTTTVESDFGTISIVKLNFRSKTTHVFRIVIELCTFFFLRQ